MRIGVECGGTFTDIVVLDSDGIVYVTDKVFSTPSRPAVAVESGLQKLPSHLLKNSDLLHGSTVATNALIERKGSVVGLITTQGFRDLLFLQRQDRAAMYDLTIQKPEPLVSRGHIVEIPERIAADGSVIFPLDETEVERALHQLISAGVESIAVSLLHAYANPEHEQRVFEIASSLAPDLPVSLSSEVTREFREYERTTTTTADAFIRPLVSGYLRDMESKAQSMGLTNFQVMQSNGGVVPSHVAATHPLAMLRSGPAAGVSGAIAIANNAGYQDIVILDMGGTSAEVAAVHEGTPEQISEINIEGLPLRLPMVDVISIGAGGGSIVDIDSGGLLSVGPASAGADPGPVCYDLGGEQPTVTDAHLVRGILRPSMFLGGKKRLDIDAAISVMDGFSSRLGQSVQQFAENVTRLASENIANAIRVTTTERGKDITNHTLVAYGGAGPLHAAEVADALGIARILIPPHAGLISAYGLLAADFKSVYSRTYLADLTAGTSLEDMQADLIARGKENLCAQGIDVSDAHYSFSAEMRYRGQGYEVAVPMPSATDLRVSDLEERFHAAHKQRFGYSEPRNRVQIVTLRLTVTKPSKHTDVPRIALNEQEDTQSTQLIIFGDKEIPCTFLRRDSLMVGRILRGATVIEDDTSTVFVPPDWKCTINDQTGLILEREII